MKMPQTGKAVFLLFKGFVFNVIKINRPLKILTGMVESYIAKFVVLVKNIRW